MTNSKQKQAGFLVPKTNSAKVNIEPINLGNTGIAYVKSHLTKSGPLSQAVAKHFGDEREAFALLPEGTSLPRAHIFESGGLMSMDAYYGWLEKYIISHWGSGKKCRLLFEDPWIKPSDIAARPPKQPYFIGGTAIYYAPQDADFKVALTAGVKEVTSFFLIGFVVSPPSSFPASGKTVDDDYINALAQNTRTVFVSAYDQESIVVWSESKA